MLETGALLDQDTLTFSAYGQPWLNQQWAASILFAAVYDVGGWLGLLLLRAVIIGATFGLVYVAGRGVEASRTVASLVTLGAFVVAATNLALRAQLLRRPALRGRAGHPRLAPAAPVAAGADPAADGGLGQYARLVLRGLGGHRPGLPGGPRGSATPAGRGHLHARCPERAGHAGDAVGPGPVGLRAGALVEPCHRRPRHRVAGAHGPLGDGHLLLRLGRPRGRSAALSGAGHLLAAGALARRSRPAQPDGRPQRDLVGHRRRSGGGDAADRTGGPWPSPR